VPRRALRMPPNDSPIRRRRGVSWKVSEAVKDR
jgi:hypothetical protein